MRVRFATGSLDTSDVVPFGGWLRVAMKHGKRLQRTRKSRLTRSPPYKTIREMTQEIADKVLSKEAEYVVIDAINTPHHGVVLVVVSKRP